MDEAKAAELMPKMARRVLKLKPNAALTRQMISAQNLRLGITDSVIQASINAQKVYSENKDKRNFYTGQIGIDQRRLIGKAEEAIRSAGYGLSNKEFEKSVREYYPKYFE